VADGIVSWRIREPLRVVDDHTPTLQGDALADIAANDITMYAE
jgi:hypothetical protein